MIKIWKNELCLRRKPVPMFSFSITPLELVQTNHVKTCSKVHCRCVYEYLLLLLTFSLLARDFPPKNYLNI